MPLTPYLSILRDMRSLTVGEAHSAFDCIFDGKCPDDQLDAFLLLLNKRGETMEEIEGAVRSMRGHMLTLEAPPDSIDIVGTGGDGRNSYNVSTAAAFVVAACGVPVAKHGNKSASSRTGSFDVLQSLGVNIDCPPPVVEKCMAEAGLCFLYAPLYHPAMRHVADSRRRLGRRTIFNLLGPLTNPAKVRSHLIGVYDPCYLRSFADILKTLGSRVTWVTHGRDGIDEISVSDATDMVILDDRDIHNAVLSPAEAGLSSAPVNALNGGDAATNAEAMRRVFVGEKSAYRDAVVLNAAAALVIAGKCADIRQGVVMAAQAIDDGAAAATCAKIIRITRASS